VRNGTLHAALEAFTLDVSAALEAERAAGAELPFEVVEEPARPTPLYCYRALTAEFIGARLGLLSALPTYASASRALEAIESMDAYLRHRGARSTPAAPRERIQLALERFLAAVFAERSQFEFDRGRFEAAFAELERVVYQGRCVTTALAPLLGVALDPATPKVALGDGLALVRGECFDDAPVEAVWGGGEANALVVFTIVGDRRAPLPVDLARSGFRRVLIALRLFESGAYALGPTAWIRPDTGSWQPLALPYSGHAGPRTAIAADHEDELRAFFNLIARRAPAGSRLAWALGRFEMAAERSVPLEALTDYLLAARALLEPEAAGTGRLADRLAAICASPADRPRVCARIAQAAALERLVVSGTVAVDPDSQALVGELCEHLRALLRDMICGHLGGDVRALADELLADEGQGAAAASPLWGVNLSDPRAR
jgi:hypothetical protein